MRRRVATASTISIHALREEGDVRDVPPQTPYLEISIHALREEGDVFQCRSLIAGHEISIHALREEGDIDHEKE